MSVVPGTGWGVLTVSVLQGPREAENPHSAAAPVQ